MRKDTTTFLITQHSRQKILSHSLIVNATMHHGFISSSSISRNLDITESRHQGIATSRNHGIPISRNHGITIPRNHPNQTIPEDLVDLAAHNRSLVLVRARGSVLTIAARRSRDWQPNRVTAVRNRTLTEHYRNIEQRAI